MPNPSKKYGETVCCAGVTPGGTWKRLYPIRFRNLQDNKFARWDWVKFDYRTPTGDHARKAAMSGRIACGLMAISRRASRVSLLTPLILSSTVEAASRGMSLTLIRPTNPVFRYRRKSPEIVTAEREGYKLAARQTSLLDEELEALDPVPYSFAFTYEDGAGKHTMKCGDWETSATFWKWSKKYGEQGALGSSVQGLQRRVPQQGRGLRHGDAKRSALRSGFCLASSASTNPSRLALPFEPAFRMARIALKGFRGPPVSPGNMRGKRGALRLPGSRPHENCARMAG